MLFDLTGKRRSVIKVIYALLALLMGGSLVLFGIGSDAPGGILDAVGLGSNTASTSNPQYEQEVEDAQERLQANPDDERALLDLVRYHYLLGQGQFETDPETGFGVPTPEATEEFERALDAWDRYLATDPRRPDPGAATNVAQIADVLFRQALASGEASAALGEAETAAAAYRTIIASDGSAADYGGLASYLYITGKDAAADRARQRAVQLTDEAERKSLGRRLEQTAKDAQKLHDQLVKAAKGAGKQGGPLDNPLGDLGGTATSPLTPAPSP